jgi:hypothetical protein
MPANLDTIRKLAFALPDVQEASCYGTPGFYVRKKMFLRIWEDGETLVVRCPIEKREELIDGNPDAFYVTDHYLNYPYVLINLLAVNERLLAEMIEAAWRLQASKKQISAFNASQRDTDAKPNSNRTKPSF